MLALLIPLLVGVAASAWLWGPFWGKQRTTASAKRRFFVLGFAILVALAVPAMFAVQAYFPILLGVQLMAGVVLTVVALLYSLLPPQRLDAENAP
jgi:Na+/melibiose symporter-like transporter